MKERKWVVASRSSQCNRGTIEIMNLRVTAHPRQTMIGIEQVSRHQIVADPQTTLDSRIDREQDVAVTSNEGVRGRETRRTAPA